MSYNPDEIDESTALEIAIAQSLLDSNNVPKTTVGQGAHQGSSNFPTSSMFVNEQEEVDRAIALSLQEQENSTGEGVVRTVEPTSSSSNKPPSSSWSFGNILGGLLGPTPKTKPSAAPPGVFAGEKPSNEPARTGNLSRPGGSGSKGIGMFERLVSDLSTEDQSLCPKCARPVSAFGRRITFASSVFHPECFCCFGCNENLLQNQSTGEHAMHAVRDGLPYHQRCARLLFMPTCVLCQNSMEGTFYTHSFFKEHQYCVSHEGDSRPPCSACKRRQPVQNSAFVTLPDGRALCPDCCATVVMESEDLRVLYKEILDFFQNVLQLPIPPAMRNVPIFAVDQFALNEHLLREQQTGRATSHSADGRGSGSSNGNGGSLTLGLTLSTVGQVRHFNRIPAARLTDLFLGGNNSSRFASQFQTSFFRIEEVREVTGILVLFGLPHDLSASILAHEAFHAWIRLSPQLNPLQPTSEGIEDGSGISAAIVASRREALLHDGNFPAAVEEGLCQLIAYKYLEYITATAASARQQSESRTHSHGTQQRREVEAEDQLAERFRAYFRHQIATDSSEVYGGGFRMARALEDVLSFPVLLEYVAEHRAFPTV